MLIHLGEAYADVVAEGSKQPFKRQRSRLDCATPRLPFLPAMSAAAISHY